MLRLSKKIAHPLIRKIESNQTTENIDVLDGNGCRTGEILDRRAIHQMGKIHRAVHLYLFNHSNNLLLQRRSSMVDHCQNILSISLTGHIMAGEASGFALHREIREELRLDPSKMSIHFCFLIGKTFVFLKNILIVNGMMFMSVGMNLRSIKSIIIKMKSPI